MSSNKRVLNKKEISEIINSFGEIIGANNTPSSGADLESQANNTTDYNAKVHAQPFRYDMLGRFGFTMLPFFESDDESGDNINDDNVPVLKSLAELMYDKFKEHLTYYFKHPHRLKSDYRIHSESDFDSQPQQNRETDYEWAKKIISTLHSHLDDDEKNNDVDEGLVQEKVLNKKTEDEFSKKSENNEVKNKKIKKIAGLINKLDKKDVDELINLLERK